MSHPIYIKQEYSNLPNQLLSLQDAYPTQLLQEFSRLSIKGKYLSIVVINELGTIVQVAYIELSQLNNWTGVMETQAYMFIVEKHRQGVLGKQKKPIFFVFPTDYIYPTIISPHQTADCSEKITLLYTYLQEFPSL
eukprot:403353363